MKKLIFGSLIALGVLLVAGSSAEAAPPTVNLVAPSSVIAGNRATVTWNTSGQVGNCIGRSIPANTDYYGTWSPQRQIAQSSGSQQFSCLTQTTTFELSCSNADGTTKRTSTTTFIPRIFTFTLSSSNVSIPAGSQGGLYLRALWEGGFTEEISLTPIAPFPPAGIGISMQRTTTTPTPTCEIIPGPNDQDKVWTDIYVADSVQPGTYPVTIRGVSDDGISRTTTFNVVVTPPPLACSPAGQTVLTGQTASISAVGGNGTYAWTATGGTPASGSGTPFGVSYTTTGTKTVSVSSNGQATACTVTVNSAPASTGTVVVNSVNAQGEAFLTTWTLSGPPGPPSGSVNQTTPSSGATYTGMPTGLYNLSAGSAEGYTVSINPGAGQSLTANGTTTFTIVYTEIPPPAGADIDITANPSSVDSGSASLLSWSGTNLVDDSCVASDGWSGSGKATSGSQSTGSITNSTTYTITCTATAGGTVADSVTVDVNGSQDDDDDDDDSQCSDGVNNDVEDELVDYPNDPGCLSSQDNNETNGAGDDDDGEVIIGACGDGFDNDGDGLIDEADGGCSGPYDDSEQASPDIREI